MNHFYSENVKTKHFNKSFRIPSISSINRILRNSGMLTANEMSMGVGASLSSMSGGGGGNKGKFLHVR